MILTVLTGIGIRIWIVYIESGIVHFNVGEDNFDMSEGQGIFINSKVVHKMHSENDAVIPNFLLSSVSDCSERKFNLSEICVTLSELIFGLLHFFFFTGMAERNFVWNAKAYTV